jgi:hypothetical protein
VIQSSGGSVSDPSATLTLSGLSVCTLLSYGPTEFGRLTPCVMHDSGSPTTSCCEYTSLQLRDALGRALAGDGSSQLRSATPEGAKLLDEVACVVGNTGRLSTVPDHAGAVPITSRLLKNT